MARIDKENYYLDIAETVLKRATCLRRCYGAIIVKNDEIISIALNAERDEDEDDDLGVNAESGNTEQQPVEQSAEQPADEQNVNTEVDGE